MNRILLIAAAVCLPLLIGCAAEKNEVRDAVDNVKDNVNGIQDKMDKHNQQLEDLSNPSR